MSHWNHRVIKHTKTSLINKIAETETWFSIHEVFYDEAGHPNGYTEGAIEPFGETLLELSEDLIRFQGALSKPVLVHEDFFPKTGSSPPRDIKQPLLAPTQKMEPDAGETRMLRIASQDVINTAWAALADATVDSFPKDEELPGSPPGFALKQPEPTIMCGAPTFGNLESPVFKSFSKPVDRHELEIQQEPGISKPCPFCQGRVLPREEWNAGTWCCDAQWRLRCSA